MRNGMTMNRMQWDIRIFWFGMFSVRLAMAMNGTKHKISEMNPNMIEFSI